MTDLSIINGELESLVVEVRELNALLDITGYRQIFPSDRYTAVYWHEQTQRLTREKADFVALTRDGTPTILDVDVYGMICPCDENENFLGFEKDGVERDWKEEIEHYQASKRSPRKVAR